MDQGARELFDKIVRKDAASLTEPEIAVLRARESYLNEQQRDKFAEVLRLKAADSDAVKPLEELSDKELKKLAKSLDLDPKDFEEPEQLIAAIREKQSAGQ